jgi:hypothetical protein
MFIFKSKLGVALFAGGIAVMPAAVMPTHNRLLNVVLVVPRCEQAVAWPSPPTDVECCCWFEGGIASFAVGMASFAVGMASFAVGMASFAVGMASFAGGIALFAEGMAFGCKTCGTVRRFKAKLGVALFAGGILRLKRKKKKRLFLSANHFSPE